jgi:hypothetical protein
MGKVYDGISAELRDWIAAQHLFFVGTAPLAGDGHVNISPRGVAGTFRVLDEHTVAWLDLVGSGAETIAHLRENGRVLVLFCALNGAPKVVRLHGTGTVVLPSDDRWADLAAGFPEHRNARAVIVVDVTRVSDSCGFGVPVFDYVGERDLLVQWADNRTDEAIADYQRKRNATSIDGLPAVPAPAVSPAETAVPSS